jgi:hypothetical protein
MTVDEMFAQKATTCTMEVLDKAIIDLIDRGEVVSYLIRYTFNINGVEKVIEAYTWCHEATAVGFTYDTVKEESKSVVYDEPSRLSTLEKAWSEKDAEVLHVGR